jgi:crotonobetainyl-CoA:carnitine CoA-transferase CaiB-like acyl-CoA transferase
VALLASGIWQIQPDVVNAGLGQIDHGGAPVQTPEEVHDGPQVRANGYIARTDMGNGVSLPLVASPVQFNEVPVRQARAPELGEHTETVLLELGMTWDEIGTLKDQGAIG